MKKASRIGKPHPLSKWAIPVRYKVAVEFDWWVVTKDGKIISARPTRAEAWASVDAINPVAIRRKRAQGYCVYTAVVIPLGAGVQATHPKMPRKRELPKT